jgi:asparagine synthase (glutamine-hydrolysing)
MAALQDAAGGTSLTGVDGDGLLDGWGSQRAWDVMCRRVRGEPRDALRIAKAALPARLRRPWFRLRTSLDMGWLQPRAKMDVDRAWADWWAGEPTVWNRRVPWWTQSRLITASLEALALLAQDAGTSVVHPLLDAKFLAALAKVGGRSGFGTRTRAMHQLFGGLLPPEVLSRTDKADFTFGYWGEESRRFAAEWNGEGLPAELVDVDALRTLWKSGVPDMRSALLLQAAWLATSGAIDAEKSFNCRLK